jgi:hypothetical protein
MVNREGENDKRSVVITPKQKEGPAIFLGSLALFALLVG